MQTSTPEARNRSQQSRAAVVHECGPVGARTGGKREGGAERFTPDARELPQTGQRSESIPIRRRRARLQRAPGRAFERGDEVPKYRRHAASSAFL